MTTIGIYWSIHHTDGDVSHCVPVPVTQATSLEVLFRFYQHIKDAESPGHTVTGVSFISHVSDRTP
jgi:hypothetical protein